MLLSFSVACKNLRSLAREKVLLPALIHAGHGCMTKEHARSFRDSGQQIKVVDERSTSVCPKSVAVSHCNLANNCDDQLLPIHLDSMKRLPFNLRDRPTLPSDTAGHFHSRFYLPELRYRLIDVLAIIIAFGIAAASGGRKRNLLITPRLIHIMMFETFWPGNDESVLNFLNSLACAGNSVLDSEPAGELRPNTKFASLRVLNPKSYRPEREGETQLQLNWFCQHDEAIPVSRLPEAILKMFFNAFFKSVVYNFETDPHAIEMEPLGNPENWLSNDVALDINWLTKASLSDLLAEYSFGVPPLGWDSQILHDLEAFRFHGASIESLRKGIAIATKPRIGSVVRKHLSMPGKQQDQRGKELTEFEKDVVDMLHSRHMSQGEIAKSSGKSKQSVSRAYKNAERKYPQLKAHASGSRSVRTERLTFDPKGRNGSHYED